jgi:uncharacterized membrane protein YbhN (UPF0104 family)
VDERISLNSSIRSWRFWLVLGTGVGLFALMFTKTSLQELVAVLKQVDVRYFVLAWVMGVIANTVRAFRFSLFFSSRGRALSLYGVFSLSRLINAAMPFGSGELVTMAILKRRGLTRSIAELAPVWLLLRVTDIFALAAWFTLAASLSTLAGTLHVFHWVILFGCAALLIGLYFFAQLASKEPKEPQPRTTQSWLDSRLAAFRQGFVHLKNRRAHASAVGLGIVLWAALIGAAASTQLAIAAPLTFTQCLLAAVLVLAVSIVPIHTPMDIGTGEAAWAAVFFLLGMHLEGAITSAIALRIVLVVNMLIDGAVGFSLLAVTRSHNDLVSDKLKLLERRRL